MTQTASATWTGAEELRPLLMPIETLTPAPFNMRQGDTPRIAESLRRYGQNTPIVLSRDGQILKGNNVHRAAVELLGWTHLAAVTADHLEDEDALLYLIADNDASDNSKLSPEAASQVQRHLLLQAETASDELAAVYRSAAEALAKAASRATAPEFQIVDPDGMTVEYCCAECRYEWSGGEGGQ